MPKLKSNRAARKRFRRTASGRIARNHAYKSHILTKKTRKRKRNLRRSAMVSPADQRRVGHLLDG